MQMVDDNGGWDWRRLEGLLPRESLERIASVQPPHSDGGEDKPFWRWESNGQFSARSAYGYLLSDTESGFDQGLVLAIKRWLRHDWRVRVKHVPRGQNRVADKLAAKGRWLDYMPIFLATVPDDVVDLVTEERERSSTERVRSENLPGFPYDPGGDSGNRF
ncbi:hypothetical protein V6N13_131027 [Hibiscus sabdariffa]